MTEMEFVTLAVTVLGVLMILIGALLIGSAAASASRYREYQGRIVDYIRRAGESRCRPVVEFEKDGQLVRCTAKQIRYTELKRLKDQPVKIYAYSRKGILDLVWNCLVDTGSAFSRPGMLRMLPLAALFAVVGVFFLLLLKVLTGAQ